MSYYGVDINILAERLRSARANCNLTQEEVAGKLGVARTTLVAIERGHRRVRLEELTAFSQIYNVSVGHLTAPDSVHVDLSGKFRKIDGKAESESVANSINLLNRLATGAVELERALGVEFRPDYPLPVRIAANAYVQQAEDAAISLRQRLGLGLGRIGDLFSAFELDLGVRVFSRPLSDSTISGLYAYDVAVGACILVNSNHSRRRRLQTLAHEVGHFVSDRSHADILDDEPTPISLEERFARRFGPAFLMPAPQLRSRFEQTVYEAGEFNVRALVLLSHQFDVSTEGMCRRLEDLNLLEGGTWNSIRDRGFNRNMELEVLGDAEPASFPPLVAPRLSYLASRAVEEGVLSEGQLCEMLVVDRSELGDVLSPFVGIRKDD